MKESGTPGGYEILRATIQDATQKRFEEALQDLVLRPAGMVDSPFLQPLPDALVPQAQLGITLTGVSFRAAGVLFLNLPPEGCGRRRRMSPSSWSRLPARIAARRATCSIERRRKPCSPRRTADRMGSAVR